MGNLRTFRMFLATAAVAALVAVPTASQAVTVLFTGIAAPGGAGQGVIGHDFVAASSIPHMSAFYASVGVAGPYTALASPDSYDFTTGGDLPVGSNVPPRQFGATAAAVPALAAYGITGSLHLGIRGFTLDYNNPSDLFTTGPLGEQRIYRNGEAGIFEETSPGVFTQIAAYSDGIFTIDIDYGTGAITNSFNGTLTPGSMTIFPETWTGTSFDPINVAGASPELYGGFSITSELQVAEVLPAPATPAMLGIAAIVLHLSRRRFFG